ncbi:MAG TPA: serine/threonine-protein kinase [Gemmatimonadales bacterium]
MSRRCTKCGTVYEGDARFCPKDGNPLVDVAVAGSSGTTIRKAYKPKTPDRFTLTSQRVDNRYEVVRRLGEGGMSYVYEAKDLTRGTVVAIKILSPKLSADKSSVERLRREAGLAMRLEHPHVCKILRLGETEDGLIYLVMPYLKGELLSDREVKVGPIDMDIGIEWLGQICSGLHHAHQLHIVHRDLKPENVMIVPDDDGTDKAVVMDFGLAKENRADPSMAKLTATGIILGTPEFMSPEQIRGKQLDARSDVYALGIVAFEMFTGKLPFQGRSAQEMMIARLRGKPTPLRQYRADISDAVDKALMRSLESDPADRYPTTLEFGKAMAEAHGSAAVLERLRPLLR